MKKYFRKLFKYNDWANCRLLITLEENEFKNEKLLSLFSHIISVQIIWLNRIKDLPTSPFPIWEQYKLRELRTMTDESATHWASYLDEHRFETFEEMIFYKTQEGKKCESTIGDIITQVINYSNYYRGQIALLLKEEGIEPPVMDFIEYQREGHL